MYLSLCFNVLGKAEFTLAYLLFIFNEAVFWTGNLSHEGHFLLFYLLFYSIEASLKSNNLRLPFSSNALNLPPFISKYGANLLILAIFIQIIRSFILAFIHLLNNFLFLSSHLSPTLLLLGLLVVRISELVVGMRKDAFLFVDIIFEFASEGLLIALESFHKWALILGFSLRGLILMLIGIIAEKTSLG